MYVPLQFYDLQSSFSVNGFYFEGKPMEIHIYQRKIDSFYLGCYFGEIINICSIVLVIMKQFDSYEKNEADLFYIR